MLSTSDQLTALLQGQLERGQGSRLIRDVAEPQAAAGAHVAVLFGSRAQRQSRSCEAGLLVCGPDLELPEDCASDILRVDDAQAALVALLGHFRAADPPATGVHPSAQIDPTAQLGEQLVVGPSVVIEAGARIGDRCQLGAQTYIGPGVELGSECQLQPSVRILAGSKLSRGVRVGSGTVIGSDGFGHLPPDERGVRVPIPQRGSVQVGEGAEIGALCAIDRGTIGDTVVGPHARLDNLVQVGHNSTIAAGAVLVAQVGISGSCRIGRGAVLAGQAGVADHREIGDGAVLTARAAAFRDVPAGEVYGGFPARPRKRWLAEQATLSQLSRRASGEQAASQGEDESDGGN